MYDRFSCDIHPGASHYALCPRDLLLRRTTLPSSVTVHQAVALSGRTRQSGVSCPQHGGSSMTMDVKAETQKSSAPQECAGCGKKITERFLLKALDLFWHEDCLKCGCCDCRLGEVGSTLYTKADLILCRRDYLRLFGNTGHCAACSKVIPAFEMVMRARNNVYHLECFACQQCNHRFCVGDRFYLCENKILCEYDYEERLVFANMAYNPPSLAHIKRHLPPPPTSASHLSQVTSRPSAGLPVVGVGSTLCTLGTNGDLRSASGESSNHTNGFNTDNMGFDSK